MTRATAPRPVAPVVTESPETRLAAAMAEADRVAAERAAAEQKLADVRDKAAALAKQIADAEAEAAKVAAAEARAVQATIDAQRAIEPDPVTIEVARTSGQSLVDAFSNCERTDANKSVPELWKVADDVRCRLLTSAVDEDARAVVLAIEGVVIAMDEWEHVRTIEYNDALDDETRRRMDIIDIRVQLRPGDSGRIARRVRELKMVVDGEVPPPIKERIGQLIASGVSVNQICKMFGLVRIDGAADLAGLGEIIDGSLAAFGWYGDVGRWHHLAVTGLMSSDAAWEWRQIELQRRRQIEHGRVGSPARIYETRFGREAVYRPQVAEQSERTPAFHHSLVTIADRRAAAKARGDAAVNGDVVNRPLDRY